MRRHTTSQTAPPELTPTREPARTMPGAPTVHADMKTPRALTPAELEWETDTIDPRRAAATLVGDPARAGPYTVRYRAAAGYELPLHMHPEDDEQLTILSGVLRYSGGAPGSGAPEYDLGPGSYVLTPAGTPHRMTAVEECVLQMTGYGPHTYVYLDERGNPRR